MLPLRARPPAAVPLSSSTTSAYYSFPLPSSSSSCCTAARCSVGSSAKLSEPLRSDSDPWGADQGVVATTDDGEQRFNKDGPDRDRKGIHVPRQRYIAVPKAALLDAVLSQFPSEADAADFKRCARCLDAILHAEHKGMLEEMRTSYMLTQRHQEEDDYQTGSSDVQAIVNGKTSSGLFGITQEDGTLFLTRSLGLRTLLGLTPQPGSDTRAAFATKFQRSFMNLLRNAQFEELSAQDLLLTYALNTDYLLTLPIYVDWKKAAESNAIIFRRGYATERQKGLLLVEKLDYLQSKLLQNIFFSLSKPLKKPGKWLNEAKFSTENYPCKYMGTCKQRILQQQFLGDSESFFSYLIWEVHSSECRVVSASGGSRNGCVCGWGGGGGAGAPREPPLDPPLFLCLFNNCLIKYLHHMQEKKKQEPAFQELILLYTDETAQSEKKDKYEMLPLQLKIYEKIPIPDLPVVFPHKKLSFRILDTVRLDIATVIGLLAYVVNYKFESLASSPSAFLLDVVALSALLILVFRVALGYKQTRDRYQLLVNKTLYEKTLASGFGSIYFLLDASEQQQYKEALLVYAMLLCRKKYQVSSRASIRDTCEQFMYEKFKAKIEMPIDKAIETLVRLGLVIELPTNGGSSVIGVPCSEAYGILRSRWDSLLEQRTEQA
ncbi:uncharacterized protein LOC120702323 isoform X2 [Panicum virgatum]|uniref:uncharacterized protein LOC120702323 isoform X2 n=1 Tax=Panicum virgatum TaxID=38727 RepID=UPI0019D5B545|nr:uncharacterized protein LOC120702323 isoform X2 [Panicum virgatum]